jgi:two-component system chemotaxis response regulator CheB
VPPIRVLVVDDAVVVRRLVTDVLAADPGIEVVGVAANGRIALQKIEQLGPDLVTLDVEMPEMDGLETIVEIRKRWPRLPVIMFSTLTERAAAVTLEALARGASDYVTKPANVGSVLAAQQRVRDDLIPRIRGLGGAPAAPAAPAALPTAAAPLPPLAALAPRAAVGAPARRVDLVAIGASTGGPNALAELIPRIPADFPVPVVIAQHMPAVFTKLLADRLSTRSQLRVREAADGAPLVPGTVWVAPGDYHMGFTRKGTEIVIALNQEPSEHSCRPAVDATLRAAHALRTRPARWCGGCPASSPVPASPTPCCRSAGWATRSCGAWRRAARAPRRRAARPAARRPPSPRRRETRPSR